MDQTELIYRVSFWVCLISVAIGAAIGIAGIWIEGERFRDAAWKGFFTALILFCASGLVAGITRWLITR